MNNTGKEQDPSDGALLCAWNDGDPSSFTELVRRHESGLIRHAKALLGGVGAYEDVVQDALLKLARGGLVISAEVAGDSEAERRVMSAWLLSLIHI